MTLAKQRARAPEEKAERRNDLLDAARVLFVRNGHRLASAEEVADQAGLSKATVWVYFRTKEEMYVALYEQGLKGLLAEISAAVRADDEPLPAERVKAAMRDFILRFPEFLALGSLLNSVLERNVSLEFVREHKRQMAAALLETAGELATVFPGADARALFLRSYALALGLWQLSEPAPVIRDLLRDDAELALFQVDFHAELSDALDVIWRDAAPSTPVLPARRRGPNKSTTKSTRRK